MKKLRKILAEEGLQASSGKYVVIGNYGRGVQTLWPKTAKPGAYPQLEAQRIADKLNGSAGRQNRPGGGVHWHHKPLEDALEYVNRHEAVVAIQRLQEKHGLHDEEDW